MPFAANTILLKNIPLSYLDGRLLLNGTGLSFVNEGSTPSNVVFTTGDQTISGRKIFAGSLDAGNRYLISSDGYNVLDWEDRVLSTAGVTKLDWGVNEIYGVWGYTGAATLSSHLVNYNALTGYSYPKATNPSGYITQTDLNLYATEIFVTDSSGHLQSQVDDLESQLGNFVPYNGATSNVDIGSFYFKCGSLESDQVIGTAGSPAFLNYGIRVGEGGGGTSNPKIIFTYNFNSAFLIAPTDLSTSQQWLLPNSGGTLATEESVAFSYYPISDNPSNYITGIPSDVIRNTGAQEISGTKTFTENLIASSGGVELYNSNSSTFRSLSNELVCDMQNLVLYTHGGFGWNIMDSTEPSYNLHLNSDGKIRFDYHSTEIRMDSPGLWLYGQERLNWETQTLTDIWRMNAVPTDSGHLVNKGYLDSQTGLVRTTGTQTVSGDKTFKSATVFDQAVNCNKGFYAYDSDGGYCIDSVNRFLHDASDLPTVAWETRELNGVWTHSSTPTGASNIANKAYVDSNSIYSMQFGHASLAPMDSTKYYFGGAFSDVPTSTQATSPVMVVPTSGVLRKIVGNASIMTTLGTAETVSMIVYKNGIAAATGTYLATGYNNKIFSGLSSINLNVNALDTLQLAMSCPAWVFNPVGINNSLVAQISLG